MIAVEQAERPRGERQSLAGARVAFTGRLGSMTRAEAFAAVRGAGGVPSSRVSRRTSLLVIGRLGLPLRANGEVSRLLEQAEELQAQAAQVGDDNSGIRIIHEDRFLELLGRSEHERPAGKSYPLEQAAQLVGVAPNLIRRWEDLGLIRTHAGYCDFRDIVSLQTIASLIARGVRPQVIARSLRGLAEVVPGIEQPLAQLDIVVADSGQLLAQLEDGLIDAAGQHHLPFDQPRQALEGEASCGGFALAAAASVDDLLDAALCFEEREQFAQAVAACHQAIALDPNRHEAYFNLGNALRLLGRADAAEAMYGLALLHGPDEMQAALIHYNRAEVQEQMSRHGEAAASLRQAVQCDPDFADAHFNLAWQLEEQGRHDEAAPHWRHYLELDPWSSWAEEARRAMGEG